MITRSSPKAPGGMPTAPAGAVYGIAELIQTLDRRGGDLDCWPQAEQDRAVALAAIEPAARTLIDQAARLDTITAAIVRPQPLPAALVGRVVGGLHGHRRRPERVWRATPRLAFASLAGLMMCAALGVGLGLAVPQQAETTLASQDLTVTVLGFDPGEVL